MKHTTTSLLNAYLADRVRKLTHDVADAPAGTRGLIHDLVDAAYGLALAEREADICTMPRVRAMVEALDDSVQEGPHRSRMLGEILSPVVAATKQYVETAQTLADEARAEREQDLLARGFSRGEAQATDELGA